RRAFAHRRAALRPQADTASRSAAVELRQDGIGAEETTGTGAAAATALLHRPFQRAFDRRRRGVDIVAVQTKPGLEPQAVAGAEPDRLHRAIGQQPAGKLLGLIGRYRNLETVLAGIARARDETVDAVDPIRLRIHEPHR